VSAGAKSEIVQLQAKIEDHKKELEHRAVTIAAIQRNFENLSSVAHADRQELSALREAEVRRRDESLAAAEELGGTELHGVFKISVQLRTSYVCHQFIEIRF
jgi:chromosome segregation ATPase